MIRFGLLFLVNLFFVFFHVEAQVNSVGDEGSPNFQPSLAVVIGILCVMFALTFVLLVYAKFCHRVASVRGDSQNLPALIRSTSRFSGIDKTVIESLPFFRFSSLKGSRDGLECVVCLSKFEDIEVLRLLPKCKHAFHINCVDQWLEKHSSCPLCRCKVSAEDPTIFTYSNSMRFLFGNQSELQADSNVELFVQREETHRGSSRFSIGSSFRKVEKGNKDEEDALIQVEEEEADTSPDDDQTKIFDKFNHKIIISDVVLKNRWSSVSSSDLMFLSSEMLQEMSSNRFSSLDSNNEELTATRTIEGKQIMKIKEEMEMKRLFENKFSSINNYRFPDHPSTSDSNATSSIMNSAGRRSVSEITALSRFRNLSVKNTIRETLSGGNNTNLERQQRLWLPIARRTVEWFANRERRSGKPKHTLDV